MRSIQNLAGQKFSKWTVLFEAGVDASKRKIWRCRCECGKEANVRGYNLLSGSAKNCPGCRPQNKGYRKLKEYGVWRGMLQRTSSACTLKSRRDYYERGISTCAQWRGKGGFDVFFKDMGSRPSPKHQLDRINNDGNYEPSNCRWATIEEQSKNKRPSNYLRNATYEDLIAELHRRNIREMERATA